MAKVYAGVDSIRLSPELGKNSTSFQETTTVKFGNGSFKPKGTGSGSGSLQRQAYNYNQSNRDFTRKYRQTGFFSGPDLPENTYAWDCWFYLSTSSAGNGSSNDPSIFSWVTKNSATTTNTLELRVTGDNLITLVRMNGSVVGDTIATINSATFSETNFLGAWWWVGFQKEVSTLNGLPSSHRKMWMAKSGTATQVVNSNINDSGNSNSDQYRIGATGVGSGTPQFTPIDGFIDEVAIRKGNPFSGTVSCPTAAYTGNEDGMLDLYHFNQGSLTLNSAGSVNSANGTSSINGSYDFYLSTYNRNATSTSFSESAGSRLGNVTAKAELETVVSLTGFSASTSLGDLEPENQVVGISLQTNTYNSMTGAVASSTVPFPGINSFDYTGNPPGSNAVSTPLFGRVCWGLNDFTLEAFVRGDGTTAEGNIFYLPFNEGGDIDEYGRRMLCGINSSSQIIIQNSFRSNTGLNRGVILIDIDTPNASTWYHIAIVRKNNKINVLWNGEKVASDIDSAGNGSFLDGGSISDIEGLGFLFKPFGGLNDYPSEVKEFILGSGITSFPNWDGYIANFRSSYIDQYDVTQPTYYTPTGPFIGDESGTAYYAKTFSGTGNNNAGTALPQAGINQVVVIEPKGTTALNDVSISVQLNPIQVTGVSASTSLGNLVPDSEVVGISLERHTGGGLGSAGVGGAAPFKDTVVVPFTEVEASWDVGDMANISYGVYTNNSLKNVYSFYNDFTIEVFLRGDGNFYAGRFLGIEIENGNASGVFSHLSVRHDVSGPSEQIILYNEDSSGNENDLVSIPIPDTGSSSWKHFALIRKNNKYSVFWDGNRVAYNIDSSGGGTISNGSINIGSGDAYLFKPFGGNNPTNQAYTRNVYFGTGENIFTTPVLAGYFANPRISFIAQYDPDSSSLDIPTTAFDADASGQDFYNKGQGSAAFNNFSTTLPTTGGGNFNTTTSIGSITTEIGALGEANGYLLQVEEGTVDAQVVLDPIQVTGQNLITSLASAAGGVGVFAPVTGQNLTVSLGSINLPVTWSNVTTGTTSTWTPVDTGGNALGP